ncbi:CopG family transcriptional regulator [Corynebacterium halotolerans]|uniref:CopG family transcriptional regulator n=1 Tax=Corynebacterium halotolerans TaxID=225326 RepID=UPI003CEC8782
MAMTLRLNEEQDRALTLLARAQGSSKHEAAVRAIISTAARTLADAEVEGLAREILPGYAETRRRIRTTRPQPGEDAPWPL